MNELFRECSDVNLGWDCTDSWLCNEGTCPVTSDMDCIVNDYVAVL